MSYDKAAAWVVAQLAEGLHHAHQRGVLHRDIKPSNILLSSEGQPLLLDFNVAQEVTAESTVAILGGTVAYAAPEHLAALLHRTSELIRNVDRRSDLYSLGLVLAEILTGDRLFEQGGSYSAVTTQIETMAVERSKHAPSLREVRRDVPWTLESIVHKCLDPDPSRRYQQGDHLAEDLRRFLEDRPLKYAPELSRIDRVRKFFRRNPRLLTAGPIFAAATAALLLVGAAWLGARSHLAEARARLGKRAHDEGLRPARPSAWSTRYWGDGTTCGWASRFARRRWRFTAPRTAGGPRTIRTGRGCRRRSGVSSPRTIGSCSCCWRGPAPGWPRATGRR